MYQPTLNQVIKKLSSQIDSRKDEVIHTDNSPFGRLYLSKVERDVYVDSLDLKKAPTRSYFRGHRIYLEKK